ncbi:MAG: hypothetical protein GYA21_17440 [Myxococcales bacterium]|nr:hypothetical protein [Myxococcales bacterium]
MDTELLQRTQLFSCWLCLGGLAVWAAVRLGERLRRKPWPRLAEPLGVVLAALALRCLFAPFAPIHENAHGYEFLGTVFSLQGSFYHGAGFYAFHHPFTLLFGARPESVFGVNLALSALSALLLLRLSRRLGLPPGAGLAAAVAWSAWPAAVRSAGSECFFPLSVCACLVSLLTWLAAWERGRVLDFVAAALAAAFAMQTRPELVLWPVLLSLAWLARPGWSRVLRTPGPYLALGLFLLLTAGWLGGRLQAWSLEGLPQPVRLGLPRTLEAFFSSDHVLLNPAWTSPLLPALALAGVIGLGLERWRMAAILLGGYLLFSIPVVGVGSGLASDLRLQQLAAPFAFLLAGAGLAFLADRFGPRARYPAKVGLLVALTLSSLVLVGKAATDFAPQREYRFLQRAVPRLPQECELVVADRFMARRRVSAEFPAFWLPRARLVEVSQLLEEGSGPAAGCRLFYRGLACATFLSDEEAPQVGIRPECRRLEERYRLEPWLEERIPGITDASFLLLPPDGVTLGFYRLSPRGMSAELNPGGPVR